MDIGTLYMIVTLKNGEMRTDAIPNQELQYCWRSEKNTRKALVWCIPDSVYYMHIAR